MKLSTGLLSAALICVVVHSSILRLESVPMAETHEVRHEYTQLDREAIMTTYEAVNRKPADSYSTALS